MNSFNGRIFEILFGIDRFRFGCQVLSHFFFFSPLPLKTKDGRIFVLLTTSLLFYFSSILMVMSPAGTVSCRILGNGPPTVRDGAGYHRLSKS
jgi:hypothetical protein